MMTAHTPSYSHHVAQLQKGGRKLAKSLLSIINNMLTEITRIIAIRRQMLVDWFGTT
jgi:hypothetical protein